jgi:hypothetical protein
LVFDHFSIYGTLAQELTSFAGRFANGFVFQNEPIFARFRLCFGAAIFVSGEDWGAKFRAPNLLF